MSQSRRSKDFRREQDAQVARVRRGDGERSLVVTGYAPGGDALKAQPTPGDQKFPFVKDVPDVEGPFDLREATLSTGQPNPLPLGTDPYLAEGQVGAFERSVAIDVAGIRQVVLVGLYFPGDNGQGAAVGELSIIPQARLLPVQTSGDDSVLDQWRTIGVVDPTINVPGVVQSYGMRRAYPTEIRVTPNYNPANPLVPTPIPLLRGVPVTLAFDVGIYRGFRFQWADLTTATALLQARYYLMR